MEQSDFDKLLERYLAGQVSEQERLKIEAWLNVMKTEDKYSDLELSREDEDRLFLKITANVDNVDEIIALTTRGKKISVTGWVMRIAAGLLIMSLVSYGGWYLTNKDQSKFQVSSTNGVEKVILNDGTLAWLRGESTLAYYEKPDEGLRYAELNGEALFEVAKDAGHPFVIRCGKATIRVLGTSFNLKSGNDSLELKVLTGRVHLSSETDKAGIDVEPKEKVIYTGKRGIQKQQLNEREINSLTTDTEYNMQFSNTSMDQVVERIGRKFNVEFRIADKRSGLCRITADFTDHSLESTLQMITEVLDVEYARSGNTVTLTGPGCH
jgi:ferric-dicitrate binding protein FerR (iron transport regulator)